MVEERGRVQEESNEQEHELVQIVCIARKPHLREKLFVVEIKFDEEQEGFRPIGSIERVVLMGDLMEKSGWS